MPAPNPFDNNLIVKLADNIRVLSVAMVEKANSGHPGGAMGGADFVSVLFTEFLNENPDNPRWFYRDRFFMDPGHMSPMLYSILSMSGKYSMEDLSNFRQWGSPTPGHPEVDLDRGVENTSGPLGQGHTNAVGAAIAERFLSHRFGNWMEHKIYTFISDGGIQEEIAQGAGRIAGHLGLSNLVMFFDSNDIQLSTTVDEVTVEDFEAKYKAWGWHVITINGNDIDAIRSALNKANAEEEKPTLIIGKTTMGYGAVDANGNSFERQVSTHGQPLSKAGGDAAATIKKLGGDPEDPFKIFPEVKALFEQVAEWKKVHVERVDEQAEDWANFSADEAELLKRYIKGDAPVVDFSAIEQKEGVATRAASSAVLSTFADQIGNMIVASADLSNSDKTDGFLKKTTALKRGDFSGAFLQAGVAELTMAAMANGMALHGGIIPVVGTFFVFSDFMKPAVRLAALMKLPVKYVWTHDAFRVGEDGPTHQPVEHEAQIRLLEQLKNHSGENSVLVLRPADANETTVAWKMALENTSTPTALILSRQNIKNLPTDGANPYERALAAEKGGYVVLAGGSNPVVTLLASGSEVSTCVAAAETLSDSGIHARVVSIPSEGLFFNQDESYQEEVLPADVPRVGLTAGLPSTLARLVGSNGISIGLDHFGYSAPAGVLDEKFGFTGDQVAEKVKNFLAK